MAETKETRSFNQRLMDAIAEMENPTKNAKANVGKFSYNYEQLDQVLDIIIPALRNHGLALTQRQAWSEAYDSCVLETVIFDESTETVMDTRPLPAQPDAQKAGSYETYMRRYALKTVFGLAGEDDDGAATKQQPRTAQKASGEQYATLYELVGRMAEATGNDTFTVQDEVIRSKAVQAKSWENMTSKQAQDAINQLNVWLDKMEPELSSEDISF